MKRRVSRLRPTEGSIHLILGDKEAASNSVSVRTRGKGDQGSAMLHEFVVRAQKLVADKGTRVVSGTIFF